MFGEIQLPTAMYVFRIISGLMAIVRRAREGVMMRSGVSS